MPKGIYPRKKKSLMIPASKSLGTNGLQEPKDTQRIGITLKGRTDIKVMDLKGVMFGTVVVDEKGVQIITPNTKTVPALAVR
jgi:hypothetical protein